MAACVIGAHIDQLDYASEPIVMNPRDFIDVFEAYRVTVKNLLMEQKP